MSNASRFSFSEPQQTDGQTDEKKISKDSALCDFRQGGTKRKIYPKMTSLLKNLVSRRKNIFSSEETGEGIKTTERSTVSVSGYDRFCLDWLVMKPIMLYEIKNNKTQIF